MPKQEPKPETLEELTERIDGLTRQLEDSELSLEDAVRAYEEGIRLLRSAQDRLDRAAQQVRLISQNDEENGIDLQNGAVEPATEPS